MPDFGSRAGKLVYSGVIAFCAAVIFAATLWTIWRVGPELESRFQPVAGKLQILSAIEIEPNVVEIRARFEKKRDCEYIRVSWYVGKPDGDFEQVRVQTLVDNSKLQEPVSTSRPVGMNLAGPWRIGMSLDNLRNNSFAILTYRCHPFWLTPNVFYP